MFGIVEKNPEIIKFKKIIAIKSVFKRGYFAPLSFSETLIVNGFLVSCYADFKAHDLAHHGMLPLRLYLCTKRKFIKTEEPMEGYHPYAKFLIGVKKFWDKRKNNFCF